MTDEHPHNLLLRVRNFFRGNIKWFTRSSIFVLFLLIVLNALVPSFMELLGAVLGFPKPSLMTVVGVAILFFLLERIIIIEDEIKHPPIHIYQTKEEAYDKLPQQVSSRKVVHIDLLQFSGYTVLRLLREIAERWPRAKIRMLLFDPQLSTQYDTDRKHGHTQRINATIDQIEVMEDSYKESGFKVHIRYYRVGPSISSVIFDSRVVSISWYRSFPDRRKADVIHLRGHDCLTLTGGGEAALPLLTFAQEHFDSLWATGEEARTSSNN